MRHWARRIVEDDLVRLEAEASAHSLNGEFRNDREWLCSDDHDLALLLNNEGASGCGGLVLFKRCLDCESRILSPIGHDRILPIWCARPLVDFWRAFEWAVGDVPRSPLMGGSLGGRGGSVGVISGGAT